MKIKQAFQHILPILGILLAALTLGQYALSWVQTNDNINIVAGELRSTSNGITGGFESDLGKTTYLIGGSTGTVRQGYIPGDRKYYTFVINVPLDVLLAKENSTLSLTVSLTVTASTTDTATANSGVMADFLNRLTVEQDAIELAVLSRHEFGTGSGSVQYDVVSFAGNNHITNTTSPTSLTNAAVPSFYQNNICSCKTTIVVSAAPWSDLEGTAVPWDNDGVQTVSMMVFMPIWYQDTGASQDSEKDCVLEISDCKLTY